MIFHKFRKNSCLYSLALVAFFQPYALLAAKDDAVAAPKNYYVEAGSYGTQRETDPPRYVRRASDTGYEALKDYDWLYLGADQRTRYEYRDNDFRRSIKAIDNPVLFRSRAFVGVKELFDPFRFVVEFEDSRRINTQFVRDNRDVNEYEFIQGYGELYFKDALGDNRPFNIRFGRMSFEFLDRRLLANNEWRNTTNTFQGFRAALGKESNDWQLDLLALQPLLRELTAVDRRNENQLLYGAIGHWRGWSDIITLEPFYLMMDQRKSAATVRRIIHSPGLRGYGFFGNKKFDYDFDIVYQTGRAGNEDHKAFGSVFELGYHFDHEWKPRLSFNYGYGSGDESPNDKESNRFERFYGFARPWSNNDYFQWENIHAPKLRLEFVPLPKLRIDTGYNGYWLASDTDRWNVANLRDQTGRSGNFIGHEFDIRTRYPVAKLVDANVGYAHFQSGNFLQNAGRGGNSDFFYLQITFRLFE